MVEFALQLSLEEQAPVGNLMNPSDGVDRYHPEGGERGTSPLELFKSSQKIQLLLVLTGGLYFMIRLFRSSSGKPTF